LEKSNYCEEIEKGFSVDGGNKHTLWKCCGCGHVFLVHEHWFSEDYDPETGRPEHYKDYHPPLPKRVRPCFEFEYCGGAFFMSSQGFGMLTSEIYTAFNSDLPALAAMGTRALLDNVMNSLVGDLGGFTAKVHQMIKQDYISRKQANVLLDVLELGHSAMHRGHIPKKRDVELALDIIETLLQMLMRIEGKARILRKRVPERKTPDKKPGKKNP